MTTQTRNEAAERHVYEPGRDPLLCRHCDQPEFSSTSGPDFYHKRTNTTRYVSLSQRLIARSAMTKDGHRIWQGPKNPDGYGTLLVKGVTELAHRLAFQEWVGSIPADMQIDHLCRRRDCIAVTHMELVTSRENTMRGEGPTAVNAAKTHCPQGHEYTPENTRVRRGRRHCRECDLEYKRNAKSKAYEQGVADGRRATVERIREAVIYQNDPPAEAGLAWLFAILDEVRDA